MKNRELELKLRIENESACNSILESMNYEAFCMVGDIHSQRMEAFYFDTPSKTLMNDRISYRIRREEDAWVATVKCGSSVSEGLFTREEYNMLASGPNPDLSIFFDQPIGVHISKIVDKEALMVLFKTVFVRLSVLLTYPNGTVIELAVDKGDIISGDKTEPIAEVELELKEGSVEDIMDLGKILCQRYPLFPDNRSKFMRGLVLSGHYPCL